MHTPVASLSDDPCPVDDAENVELFRLAGYNVRFNLRALKPDQGASQGIVATAISDAVCCLQEIVSLHPQCLGRRLTVIDRSDQLADAVN